MSLDPHAIKIYIDGSALKNPGGPGGIAAWIEFPMDWDREEEPLFQEGFHETTNNRMELLACIRAFDYVRRHTFDVDVQRVQIVTDSQYVHEFFYLAETWRKNDWRNSDGKPVENRDLWKDLLSVRNKVRLRTTLEWMKGKTSSILKAVDRSAKVASSQPWSSDRGFRGGKVAASRVGAKNAASMFPANGQERVIRIYRNKPAGRLEHKIYFTIFSEASGQFVEKAYAFASPEIALELHRQHAYRVLFNANPKYPIIDRIIAEVRRENGKATEMAI